MKPPPPPIRFLMAVVGCWAGVRAYQLWPKRGDLGAGTAVAAAPARPPAALPASPPLAQSEYKPAFAWSPPAGVRSQFPVDWRPTAGVVSGAPLASATWGIARRQVGTDAQPLPPSSKPSAPQLAFAGPPLAYPPLLPAAVTSAPQPTRAGPSRWSGSAWLFVREAAADGNLVPGGTLGGSQAGGRLAYRLNNDARRPLSISARVYAPLERPEGAEFALGVDWKPIANLPVHILAERRERLGQEGRSDFGVTLYAGGERRIFNGRLRLEAYGQAGVVGLKERDLFADGAVRAGTPVGRSEIGVGAWGGAQPGAARLDVGPQVSLRIPIGRTSIRASAEWRFRVGGDAEPRSGPALTLATGF